MFMIIFVILFVLGNVLEVMVIEIFGCECLFVWRLMDLMWEGKFVISSFVGFESNFNIFMWNVMICFVFFFSM